MPSRTAHYPRVPPSARAISTPLELLRAKACAKIYREKASEAQADRRELLKLLKEHRPRRRGGVEQIVRRHMPPGTRRKQPGARR